MKMCAFVTRVSDERQGTDRGNSPENQRIQLERYLEFRNADAGDNPEGQLGMYKEYKLEGVSGEKSFDSPKFQELREDVLHGEIDVVIATGLDRFGRNVVKFLEFFLFLQQHKVDLVVTHYQIDTSTPTGQLVITILMALAEMQRLQYSEKMIHSRHTRLTQGLRSGGTIPLGFDRHPTTPGLFVVNDLEATVVRLVFSLYLKLKSLSGVARELNKRGHRTKRVPCKKGGFRGDNKFAADKVRYILNNYIYIGLLEEHKANKGKPDSEVPKNHRYNRYVPENPDLWPKLIDKAVFEKAQLLLATHSRSNRFGTRKIYPYILSGLAVCAFCGNNLEAVKGGKHHYYACKNKECNGRELFAKKTVRLNRNAIDASALEEAVIKLVVETLADSPANITGITKACNKSLSVQISSLIDELKVLKDKRERSMSIREGLAISLAEKDIDSSYATKLTDKIRDTFIEETHIAKQIEELEQRIVCAKEKEISESVIKHSLGLISSFTEEQQKDVLRMFISEVKVGLETVDVHLLLDQIMCLSRSGPNPHEFVWLMGWHARQDLNPEPSGP